MTGRTAGRPHRDRAHRAGRFRGRELRVRRHAGAAGQRPDHRARHGRCRARCAGGGFPERAAPPRKRSRASERRRMTAARPIVVPVDGRQSQTALAVARGTARLLHSLGFACVSELALAVRPPRRPGRARRQRRDLDRRDQVLGRGFPRRSEMDGLSAALRPAVLRHHAGSAVRDFPAGHRAHRCRRRSAPRSSARRPSTVCRAATRKSMLLRFGQVAASRLQSLIDPHGPYGLDLPLPAEVGSIRLRPPIVGRTR